MSQGKDRIVPDIGRLRGIWPCRGQEAWSLWFVSGENGLSFAARRVRDPAQGFNGGLASAEAPAGLECSSVSIDQKPLRGLPHNEVARPSAIGLGFVPGCAIIRLESQVE